MTTGERRAYFYAHVGHSKPFLSLKIAVDFLTISEP